MKRIRLNPLIVIALTTTLLTGLSHANRPFMLQELATLLRDNIPPRLQYEEIRDSLWLDAPVISRGTLQSVPPMLEKKSLAPTSQTWRLYPDHMEWSEGNETRVVQYVKQPKLGALSNAIRGVVFGDLNDISSDFKLTLEGGPESWRLRLTPATRELSDLLKQLEFQGTGAWIDKIIVIEAQGDTTTTVLSRTPAP